MSKKERREKTTESRPSAAPSILRSHSLLLRNTLLLLPYPPSERDSAYLNVSHASWIWKRLFTELCSSPKLTQLLSPFLGSRDSGVEDTQQEGYAATIPSAKIFHPTFLLTLPHFVCTTPLSDQRLSAKKWIPRAVYTLIFHVFHVFQPGWNTTFHSLIHLQMNNNTHIFFSRNLR